MMDRRLFELQIRWFVANREHEADGASAKLRKSCCARFSAWAIPRSFLIMLLVILRAERSCSGAFFRVPWNKDGVGGCQTTGSELSSSPRVDATHTCFQGMVAKAVRCSAPN